MNNKSNLLDKTEKLVEQMSSLADATIECAKAGIELAKVQGNLERAGELQKNIDKIESLRPTDDQE